MTTDSSPKMQALNSAADAATSEYLEAHRLLREIQSQAYGKLPGATTQIQELRRVIDRLDKLAFEYGRALERF